MSGAADPSVHASAVLVGTHAVLIRGPSGAGKSRLAFDLILAGRTGQIPPAVLVGDDRVHLWASGGRLMVGPVPQLAGLIEVRGLGIRRCEFAKEAILDLVVDLGASDAERLPPPEPTAIIGRFSGHENPGTELQHAAAGGRDGFQPRRGWCHLGAIGSGTGAAGGSQQGRSCR